MRPHPASPLSLLLSAAQSHSHFAPLSAAGLGAGSAAGFLEELADPGVVENAGDIPLDLLVHVRPEGEAAVELVLAGRPLEGPVVGHDPLVAAREPHLFRNLEESVSDGVEPRRPKERPQLGIVHLNTQAERERERMGRVSACVGKKEERERERARERERDRKHGVAFLARLGADIPPPPMAVGGRLPLTSISFFVTICGRRNPVSWASARNSLSSMAPPRHSPTRTLCVRTA